MPAPLHAALHLVIWSTLVVVAAGSPLWPFKENNASSDIHTSFVELHALRKQSRVGREVDELEMVLADEPNALLAKSVIFERVDEYKCCVCGLKSDPNSQCTIDAKKTFWKAGCDDKCKGFSEIGVPLVEVEDYGDWGKCLVLDATASKKKECTKKPDSIICAETVFDAGWEVARSGGGFEVAPKIPMCDQEWADEETSKTEVPPTMLYNLFKDDGAALKSGVYFKATDKLYLTSHDKDKCSDDGAPTKATNCDFAKKVTGQNTDYVRTRTELKFNMPTYGPTYTKDGDADATLWGTADPSIAISQQQKGADMLGEFGVQEKSEPRDACSLNVGAITYNIDRTNREPQGWDKMAEKIIEKQADIVFTCEQETDGTTVSYKTGSDSLAEMIASKSDKLQHLKKNYSLPFDGQIKQHVTSLKVTKWVGTRIDALVGEGVVYRVLPVHKRTEPVRGGTITVAKDMLYARVEVSKNSDCHETQRKSMIIKVGCAHYPPIPEAAHTGLNELFFKDEQDVVMAIADWNLRPNVASVVEAAKALELIETVNDEVQRALIIPWVQNVYKRAFKGSLGGKVEKDDPNWRTTHNFSIGANHGGLQAAWLDRVGVAVTEFETPRPGALHTSELVPWDVFYGTEEVAEQGSKTIKDLRLVVDENLSMQGIGTESDHMAVFVVYEAILRSV